MITVTHNAAEGSLVHGTARGDGTADVLTGNGWRWSRTIGAWYLPSSRDRLPRLDVLTRTVHALRAAGHDTADPEVDTTPRPTAEIERDRQQRQQARSQRLAQRADRAADAAQAAAARGREIASRIPFGQPILIGHHSERRHRRDLATIDRAHRTAAEQEERATELARRAQVAGADTRVRYQPQQVARRITHLEVEQRRLERRIHGYRNPLGDEFPPAEGANLDRLTSMLQETLDQLDYWRQIRTEQIRAGEALDLSKATVKPGDHVEYRGRWYPVVRANPKSVSVRSIVGGSWTDTIPYDQLTGHRPAPL